MALMLMLLAAFSGQTIIQGLMTLIIVGLVFWLLWWLISYIALPEPFAKVARVILAAAAVFFLINFLLGLAGSPMIKWQ